MIRPADTRCVILAQTRGCGEQQHWGWGVGRAGGQDAASVPGKQGQRIRKKLVLRGWGVPQVGQGTGRV